MIVNWYIVSRFAPVFAAARSRGDRGVPTQRGETEGVAVRGTRHERDAAAERVQSDEEIEGAVNSVAAERAQLDEETEGAVDRDARADRVGQGLATDGAADRGEQADGQSEATDGAGAQSGPNAGSLV